jgi:hypothetical protein
MFIFTMHLPKTRWVTLIAVVLILLCIIFLLVKVVPNVFFGTKSSALKAETTEDMIEFFEHNGYTVFPEPIEVVPVDIPDMFDAVYQNYEKLQQEAGFSLEKYRGCQVTRYTFLIQDHPQSSQEEVRGNLLVYQARIIGGDIMCVRLDGFMEPLLPRKDLVS